MENIASARISQLEVVDSGEIRRVQLVLPKEVEIRGAAYPLVDVMRPGTAFLAKPWGSRTDKYRRRMYTRSNSSSHDPGVLETFINHTHRPQADTSIWWQSQDATNRHEAGKGIDVRVTLDEENQVAQVYENTQECKETNLRLEPDGEWETRRFVCIAFGTGITPFLSYLRFMAHGKWEEYREDFPGHMTLVASARHEGQLMLHQELFQLAKQYSRNFDYIPVLTRSWPQDWPSLTGRIIRRKVMPLGEEQIDLSPLFDLVPDFSNADLRICGSVEACRQLIKGLQNCQISPTSLRRESW